MCNFLILGWLLWRCDSENPRNAIEMDRRAARNAKKLTSFTQKSANSRKTSPFLAAHHLKFRFTHLTIIYSDASPAMERPRHTGAWCRPMRGGSEPAKTAGPNLLRVAQQLLPTLVSGEARFFLQVHFDGRMSLMLAKTISLDICCREPTVMHRPVARQLRSRQS